MSDLPKQQHCEPSPRPKRKKKRRGLGIPCCVVAMRRVAEIIPEQARYLYFFIFRFRRYSDSHNFGIAAGKKAKGKSCNFLCLEATSSTSLGLAGAIPKVTRFPAINVRQLEESLGIAYDTIASNPVLRKELLMRNEDQFDGGSDETACTAPISRPGFFGTANPFRTARMLRASGYSRKATAGILFGIYGIVLFLEMIMLRLGMSLFQVESLADLFLGSPASSAGSTMEAGGHARTMDSEL
ncbi:unnamed protein product [Amoebophrya sp. A120]|nr:unnamed protein product [Amoebophrya sp. A120]|eukprot:GSA120T00022804001.1